MKKRIAATRGAAVLMAALITVPFQSLTVGAQQQNNIIDTADVAAISQEAVLEDEQWELVWSDEFDGSKLDETKWSYQIGNGYNGWGNYEKQYYTKENVTVSDGTLKITAKKESINGFEYTSSRIRTVTDDGETLFATKYGRIEARIKLPEGTGLWPAFWMMPVDSEYGSWPLSGEIDIMEARGRVLDTVNGTIHFGEKRPFNKNIGGSYTLADGTDITDYHVYAVEWKENEIIWYVDGVEYFRTSNWYTMTDGVVAEYPAPFNKEFYIILNMAVGGTYDSHKTPSESDLPGTMEVDYVRVYHDKAGYDETNIQMPEGTRDEAAMENIPVYEDGNLFADGDFKNINEAIMYSDDADYSNHNWFFVTNRYFPGDAALTKSVIDGDTFVNINISDPGTQTYSIQLKQLMPLAKGYVYKVKFDAKCTDGTRTIKVKPVAEASDDHMNYNDSFVANLTTEMQTFEFSFIMKEETDLNAVLEFNIAKFGGDVTIGNVEAVVMDTYSCTVEEEEQPEIEVTPDADPETEMPTESETEVTTEIETEVTTEPETEATTESETEVTTESETEVTTEPETEATTEPETEVATDSETEENTKSEMESETTATTEPQPAEIIKSAVENGDFSQGIAVWNVVGTYYALEEKDGNVYGKVYTKQKPNPWDRIWYQSGIYLTEGETYTVTFKAKSSSDNQKFIVTVEDGAYNKCMYEEFVVGKEWETITYTFVAGTDEELSLKYLLGAVTEDCKLYLDDVSIEHVE